LREREEWFFIYIKRSSRVTRVAEKRRDARGELASRPINKEDRRLKRS